MNSLEPAEHMSTSLQLRHSDEFFRLRMRTFSGQNARERYKTYRTRIVRGYVVRRERRELLHRAFDALFGSEGEHDVEVVVAIAVVSVEEAIHGQQG